MPAGMQEPGGFPQGLSWSWEMDFATLLDALGDRPSLDAGAPDAGGDGGPDGNAPNANGADANGADDGGPAGEAAVLAALEQGAERLPAGVVAVRVAERLAPGPDLVAWLETAPAGDLTDYDLPGAASSWRRVAAYAQARELAHVAQIASRAARRDKNIEVAADGRPARIPAAAAEVSLALTMTPYSAAAWTDLAVDLKWRLPATGAALAVGLIDLPRAKLIAEATGPLTDTTARAVEDRVLPTAGQHTTSMLRAALRRAVIALDPEGAQRRKEDAERRAKVSLYPEQEGTATLTAQGLPAISAAAAMARITAMARAMKSAGAGGGIDFLRAQVLTGLILGTLPLIPPAPGAPPDAEPGPSGNGDPGAGPNDSPGGPSDGLAPGDGPNGPGGPGDPGGSAGGPAGGPTAGSGEGLDGGDGGPGGGLDDGPWDGFPAPLDEDAPMDAGDDLIASQPILTGTYRPDSSYRPGKGPPFIGSPDDELGPRDQDWLETGPLPGWPGFPAEIAPIAIPPGLTPPGPGPSMSRPVPGLLDVTVPWDTLTGTSPEPGHLGRIGPITASDARRLADCATHDPATTWRIIVTNSAGQALTVTRLPRRTSAASEPRSPGPGPGTGIGLVGRITVTIPEHILDGQPPPIPGPDPVPGTGPPGILRQAFRHAAKALATARAVAQADADAGGCAHLDASVAYRVPARLRDYITARDLTCRFTTCRQPVWCCASTTPSPTTRAAGPANATTGACAGHITKSSNCRAGLFSRYRPASSSGPPPAAASTPQPPTPTLSERT